MSFLIKYMQSRIGSYVELFACNTRGVYDTRIDGKVFCHVNEVVRNDLHHTLRRGSDPYISLIIRCHHLDRAVNREISQHIEPVRSIKISELYHGSHPDSSAVIAYPAYAVRGSNRYLFKSGCF